MLWGVIQKYMYLDSPAYSAHAGGIQYANSETHFINIRYCLSDSIVSIVLALFIY